MRVRESLHKHLLYTGWYLRLMAFLKSIKLRRGEVSLHRTLIIFVDKVGDNQLFERAYGVAFNFTLSIFPSLIFLFALIPFLHSYIPVISSQEILQFLGSFMPPDLYSAFDDTIHDTVGVRRDGLISFGVLFALFLATNGVNSLIQSFNMSYKTVDNRSYIKTRLISLWLTLILAFALIVSFVFILGGQFALDWIWHHGYLTENFTYYLILFLRFLVIFVAFYVAIASIYYFGPAIHDKWRFFSHGSIMATLLCIAVSFGFSYYVTNFGTYNKLYGSIGTLIALMIWQWLMSNILLLGFEFNASIDRAANKEVYYINEDDETGI